MCGLFGLVNKNDFSNVEQILAALGKESEVRGGHATGIAYVNKDKEIKLRKDAIKAKEFSYHIHEGVKAIIGHTRYATKGSPKMNYNNHPFRNISESFAFAHNGHIGNDTALRKKFSINTPVVETDSYIAVQLVDHFGGFNIDAIIKASEQVNGSFTFTFLDKEQNIWFVKNDSPLCLIEIPSLELFLYASTELIMTKALMQVEETKQVLLQHYEQLKDKNLEKSTDFIIRHQLQPGNILKLAVDGTMNMFNFKPQVRNLAYSREYKRANSSHKSYGNDDWKDWRNWGREDFSRRGSQRSKQSFKPVSTGPLTRLELQEIGALQKIGYNTQEIGRLVEDYGAETVKVIAHKFLEKEKAKKSNAN